MTHRPYLETPEAAVRNRHAATVLELVDELAPSTDVARKVRVRLAALHGLARATSEDVRVAIAALTPPPPSEEPAP